MKGRIIAILSAIVICLTPTAVFAAEVQEEVSVDGQNLYTYTKPQALVEQEMENQIQRQIAEMQEKVGSVDPALWKNEYGTKKTVTVGGFAGNQNSGGYKFPTGGGFYFSDSGGPTASVTVTFPTKFGKVTATANLGKKSSAGIFVTAPTKTRYYKLHIAKKVEVQPYITYTRKDRNSAWKVYYRGKVQAVKGVIASAKAVG